MSSKASVLLKTDGNGDPVYVSLREYRKIMGNTKERSKRIDNRFAKKKVAKQARKRNR